MKPVSERSKWPSDEFSKMPLCKNHAVEMEKEFKEKQGSQQEQFASKDTHQVQKEFDNNERTEQACTQTDII